MVKAGHTFVSRVQKAPTSLQPEQWSVTPALLALQRLKCPQLSASLVPRGFIKMNEGRQGVAAQHFPTILYFLLN